MNAPYGPSANTGVPEWTRWSHALPSPRTVTVIMYRSNQFVPADPCVLSLDDQVRIAVFVGELTSLADRLRFLADRQNLISVVRDPAIDIKRTEGLIARQFRHSREDALALLLVDDGPSRELEEILRVLESKDLGSSRLSRCASASVDTECDGSGERVGIDPLALWPRPSPGRGPASYGLWIAVPGVAHFHETGLRGRPDPYRAAGAEDLTENSSPGEYSIGRPVTSGSHRLPSPVRQQRSRTGDPHVPVAGDGLRLPDAPRPAPTTSLPSAPRLNMIHMS